MTLALKWYNFINESKLKSMNKYTQIQKIISVLMIFVVIISTSGCSSSRKVISSSDIPVASNYYYIIHNQDEKRLLENPLIENEILSGKINYNTSVSGNKIHIYLKSEPVINATSDKMVRIPIDDIDKIEIVKVSTGKTILLVIGCTIALLLITGLLRGPYTIFDFD